MLRIPSWKSVLVAAWFIAVQFSATQAQAFVDFPLVRAGPIEALRSPPPGIPPFTGNPDPRLPWIPDDYYKAPELSGGKSDADKALQETRITRQEHEEFVDLHRRYTEICKKILRQVRTEMDPEDKCEILKELKIREDECISLREAALPIYKKIDPNDTGHELYLRERRRAREKIQQWLWNLSCET